MSYLGFTNYIQKNFKELEIIFVNDGSTDNSNKLVQEFILKKSTQ